MNTSVWMSDPSLLKYWCGLTFTYIIRSPGGPPRPLWPFFDTRKLTPLSTPFGMFMVSFTCWWVWPLPRHVTHGFLITVPAPSQLPHTYWIMKGPCLTVWKPAPPQAPHFVSPVPGLAPDPLHVVQRSVLPNATLFWHPFIASMKSISHVRMISLPWV